MPNDAKLGLVVGMGLVIAVAVVYYRKDVGTGSPAAIQKAPAATPALPPPAQNASAVVKLTGLRRHTVTTGETLAEIARVQLGSATHADAIRLFNREQLGGADEPSVGTVLVLPGNDTER